MDSQLTWEALQAKPPEQRRRLDVRRSARAGGGSSPAEVLTVTVRFATPRDSGAIERLAELDSGSAPDGVRLLELREAQLRGGRRRRIGLRRWANRRAAPLEIRP